MDACKFVAYYGKKLHSLTLYCVKNSLVWFEPTTSWLYLKASSSSMGKVNEQLITIYHPLSLSFIDLGSFLTRLKSLGITHTEVIFYVELFHLKFFQLYWIFYKRRRLELCTSFHLCVNYGFIQWLSILSFPTIPSIALAYLTINEQ